MSPERDKNILFVVEDPRRTVTKKKVGCDQGDCDRDIIRAGNRLPRRRGINHSKVDKNPGREARANNGERMDDRQSQEIPSSSRRLESTTRSPR